MLTQIHILKKFRETIYEKFLNKRRDAVMNLLDAQTSYGHRCKSIVQLSEATCFERQYSSITDAISDGLPTVDWSGISQEVFKKEPPPTEGKPVCFLVDCTGQPRMFSKALSDRTIVHSPNPTPGNKPITVGHQYSCVALLPLEPGARKKHWVIPLRMDRVTSQQKGHELGMQKVLETIENLGLQQQLTLSIGDSLYGTETCRRLAQQNEHHVHLFRFNAKRHVFSSVVPHITEKKRRGRPQKYGHKMALNHPKTHVDPDDTVQTLWVTQQGKTRVIHIRCWRHYLIRGSRDYQDTVLTVKLFCSIIF